MNFLKNTPSESFRFDLILCLVNKSSFNSSTLQQFSDSNCQLCGYAQSIIYITIGKWNGRIKRLYSFVANFNPPQNHNRKFSTFSISNEICYVKSFSNLSACLKPVITPTYFSHSLILYLYTIIILNRWLLFTSQISPALLCCSFSHLICNVNVQCGRIQIMQLIKALKAIKSELSNK